MYRALGATDGRGISGREVEYTPTKTILLFAESAAAIAARETEAYYTLGVLNGAARQHSGELAFE